MFHKGDFNIKQSWDDGEDPKSGKPNKSKPNLGQPSNQSSQQTGSNRPTSSYQGNKIGDSPRNEKRPSAILNSAAKNLVGGSSPSAKIDDDLARRLVKNLQMEGLPDNVFAQQKLNPLLGGQGGGQKRPPVGNSKNLDSDLMASMAARLQKAEQTIKMQREEIKEKQKEVDGLKTEVEVYKSSKDSETAAAEVRKVQKENVKLLQKVYAMEKFLSEYGLRWTVDDETGDEVLRGDLDKNRLIGDSKKSKYNYPLPSQVDLNTILMRINELNYSVEKDGGCQEVYKDERGFNRIRRMEPIPIGFYSDGIAMKGFPFFKYGSPEARQILADILEGYFPYQFKKEYPNGVLLKVIDKAEEVFNPSKSNPKSADINSIDENQLKPMSKDEFLAKMPKQVIKDGKIIEVRSEIQKKLDGQKPLDSINTKQELVAAKKENQRHGMGLGKVQEADLEETQDISNKGQQKNKQETRIKHETLDDGSIRILTEEYLAQKKEELKDQEVCELKIRSTKNGKSINVFVLISANKLIRDVYRIIDDFTDFFRFELLMNHPKKPIPRDSAETLKELDLFPNSVLNVNEIKS